MCLGPILLFRGSSSGSLNSSLADDYEYVSGDALSDNKVLLIKINGAILNEPESEISSLLSVGAVYGFDIKEELIQAAEDNSIKAVMIEVNSPGGTITGSNAISEGIEYFKEKTGKPVYSYGYSLIASGGYWAIANTDKIFIDKGSLVGSIGVVMGPFKYYKNVVSEDNIVTKDGVETFYITSGEGKDLGNSYRKMTDKELSILKKGSEEAYADFINHVSESRDIEKTKIEKEIGAYIYGEQTALSLGLIDQIANKQDAYKELVEKATLGEDYQVIQRKMSGGGLLDLFLGGSNGKLPEQKIESSLCIYSIQPMAYMGESVDFCTK